MWKGRFGYDDSLNVVGIHGVGGVFGILATGLFASKAINSSGADGMFFGHGAQLGIQAVTVAAVALFSLIGTWLILKVVDATSGCESLRKMSLRGWISANTMNAPTHE